MLGCKEFCAMMLRETRKGLKDRPVFLAMVKGWYTESTGMVNKKYFWVKDRHGKVLWQGGSCCSYNAKAHATDFLVEFADLSDLEACPFCDECYSNGCSELDESDNCTLTCGRCGNEINFKLGLVGADKDSSGVDESYCI